LLVLALSVVAFLGYLIWGQEEVNAASPQAPLAASATMGRYYLTESFYTGADADTACASGYHMAALWELLDVSTLRYDTDRGRTQADSGQGPPTYFEGWVRTGNSSSTSNTAGWGNCNAWTSSSSIDYGSSAYLPKDWSAGQDVHVWNVGAWECNRTLPVWCVPSYRIYLPLVLCNSA
jgi:hypothetical protein